MCVLVDFFWAFMAVSKAVESPSMDDGKAVVEDKATTNNGYDLAGRWIAPSPARPFITGLKVNNSVSGEKCAFIPNEDNIVNWYGCGPTVYDAAHMGHARNYITFDIIRRVMTDYFGYKVNMCMNITDVDDKIIARSNELNMPFDKLARYWENDFFTNMKDLNCQLPDVITRVSEFVPKIITFIESIISNGFAYHSNGSVYFDTQAFRNDPRHTYGRMEPWSVNDEARVLEGEGALGATTASEKKCPLDFALWKKSKPGEPSWDAPAWGPGRPGWHIECSVMASDVLGFPLDIHSGGIDLRFPHHDNELAQSEAKYNRPQWVNYFLHSGHLHIKGLKMSKSLKNFITIKHILGQYNPRVVRLLVLLHKWDQPMNYDPEGTSMKEPMELDRILTHFFGNLRQILRKAVAPNTTWQTVQDVETFGCSSGLVAEQLWSAAETALFESFNTTQIEIHAALCDNFNTPLVLTQIHQHLVGSVNRYLNSCQPENYRGPLLGKIANYTHRILEVFGLCNPSVNFSLPYGLKLDGDGVDHQSGGERMANLMDEVGSFRHSVRELAKSMMKSSEDKAAAKKTAQDLLKLSDTFRDENLIELGIRLEDKGDKGFVWKEGCREELLAERQQRRAEEEKSVKEKEARLKQLAEAKQRKEQEAKIPPQDFIRLTRPGEFSEFDDSGLPTVTSGGSPVSKSARDKLRKILEKHKSVYETSSK